MELDRLEVIIEAEAKKANAELDKMISKLNQVSSALGKTTGFSFGAKGVTSATTSMQRTLTSSKSLTSQLGRLAAGYYSVRKAVNFMNKSMEKSMDYVETVNLFQTSLKKIGMESAVKMGMEWGSSSANAYAKTFIDRAENFNDMLVDNLTLDPELMKNYQAVFAQMTNSMNLVSDTSMNISETFTMLGNDIASLWNIDTDKAMKKLQSGLAGQIRPLRELGIDISKTSLEMYAMNHGIEDSVEKMSQAAKVQLRYLAIMEQAEVAFGDMAKTIESPANQLRILSQQWTNLSRSIGNVFLPVVTTALPYINGLVIALRNMVDTLATAMGYEVPDYSDSNIYKDLTGDIGDMENVIEDTTDANEKLRKSMMKWDELNILSEGKSKGINLGSGYKELDEAIRQKSDSYLAKFNEELSKMSNKTNDIAENIKKFFNNVGEKLEPTTKAFKKLWDEGLSKLASFAWENLKNFYTDFLSPIGDWALGEDGLPRLIDVGNGLLNSVDWDKLSSAFKSLYDALAPFVIGVGEGLILFIEGMGEILKPIIATTADLLASAVEKLAGWINKIPTEVATALGGAIGSIATAFLIFEGATAVSGIVKSAGGALVSFVKKIAQHPLAAIGIGLAGIGGALLAISEARFKESELGKFIQYLDDLNERVGKHKEAVDELLKSQEERKKAIEEEYGAIEILAGKYFDLSEKENLSVGEKELLKSYSEELIRLLPELTPLIDAETGAYKGTKDELTELIKKTKEYYLVQAAKEDLIETAKELYNNEKLLAEQQEARDEIQTKLTAKEKEHAQAVKDLNEQVKNSSDEYSYNAYTVAGLSKEMQTYKEELKRAETNIKTTKGEQERLNAQFSKAETYVSSYSTQVSKDMKIVKSSVSSTLKEMAETVKKFTLPAIKIPVTIDDSNLASYNPVGTTYRVNAYATGGYPDMGQLFVAREAGPELVGNIGNRPAVANNDQIVQAVSQGVAMAVASVMGSSGGKAQIIENIINLDGDVLARSLNRVNQSADRRFNPVMQGV